MQVYIIAKKNELWAASTFPKIKNNNRKVLIKQQGEIKNWLEYVRLQSDIQLAIGLSRRKKYVVKVSI